MVLRAHYAVPGTDRGGTAGIRDGRLHPQWGFGGWESGICDELRWVKAQLSQSPYSLYHECAVMCLISPCGKARCEGAKVLSQQYA
eukprot:3940321-Rhodomonas_salina.6